MGGGIPALGCRLASLSKCSAKAGWWSAAPGGKGGRKGKGGTGRW